MIILPQAFLPRTRMTIELSPSSALSRVEVEMEVMWTRGGQKNHHPVLHGLRFCSGDIDKELFLVGALLRRLLAGRPS